MPRIGALSLDLIVHLGATMAGFSLLQGRDKVARSLHMDPTTDRLCKPPEQGART
jgi:hypothetical protein